VARYFVRSAASPKSDHAFRHIRSGRCGAKRLFQRFLRHVLRQRACYQQYFLLFLEAFLDLFDFFEALQHFLEPLRDFFVTLQELEGGALDPQREALERAAAKLD
jgi:hypothetical protein